MIQYRLADTFEKYGVVLAVSLAALVAAGILVSKFFPAKTTPALLYPYGAKDVGDDRRPAIAYGQGKWVVVWESNDDPMQATKSDFDVLVSASADGKVWSNPQKLVQDPALDVAEDTHADIATDGHKNWLVVWSSEANLKTAKGSIGADSDIVGLRWSDDDAALTLFRPVNNNAWSDNSAYPNPEQYDLAPRVATNGAVWRVVWQGNSDVFNRLVPDQKYMNLKDFKVPQTAA